MIERIKIAVFGERMGVSGAKFLEAFSRIGLMPDAGGTYVLPRLVGMARAMGMSMLAEPISAEQAEDWGLIWKCVDDDQLTGPRRSTR